MKIFISILFLSLAVFPSNISQKNDVSFTTILDISKATKDGIYLNGYVVNIDYGTAQKLNGKKIKVSGKVTIVKGIGKSKNVILKQGRENDTKYILKPKILVLE